MASVCSLQEGRSRQVLLLLQALLGPGVSLSLQKWLQLEGKLLLADAVKDNGFEGGTADGDVVGVAATISMAGQAEAAGGRNAVVAAAAAAGPGADAVQDRADDHVKSSRRFEEGEEEEQLLMEPVRACKLEQQLQQHQQGLHGNWQQRQLTPEPNLKGRQGQDERIACKTMKSDEPEDKRQHQEDGNKAAQRVDEGTREGVVAAADGEQGRLHRMSSGDSGGAQLRSPMGNGSSISDEMDVVWHQAQGKQGAGNSTNAIMNQAINISTAGRARGSKVSGLCKAGLGLTRTIVGFGNDCVLVYRPCMHAVASIYLAYHGYAFLAEMQSTACTCLGC